MAESQPFNYNNPNDTDGTGVNIADSTVGTQVRTDYFNKKALIEAKKEQYFSQMADVTSMPKNMGKKIKRYHYLPLLDDLNINDQGIDAAGLTATYEVRTNITNSDGEAEYFITEGAGAAAALTAATTTGSDLHHRLAQLQGDVIATVANDTYAKSLALVEGGAFGYVITHETGVQESGNLYGSSKDVGTINGKMPALSENGGRVNRVGFKRVELEGSIEKFGFFDEYTQESMDFDSDSELMMHITRESVMGANEITEDALQIDLLNGAGVIRYAGTATSVATLSGETSLAAATTVTYEDLMRLSITLDNNRTPKSTKVITGTRMVDTKTIDAARYIYIGSELIPTIKRMVDLHGNEAFIHVQKYAAAGNTATGEIGSIDQFRIIVVPEMMKWEGVGAAETAANAGFQATGGNYDVFPMLVIGSGSFTTIGFQTDGKTVKFSITHKKPGKETADKSDPYGETGFYSIKWYYGTMILRSERIALIKTVAEF